MKRIALISKPALIVALLINCASWTAGCDDAPPSSTEEAMELATPEEKQPIDIPAAPAASPQEQQEGITKSEFAEGVSDIAQLAASARVIPSIKDDKPNGCKLYAVKPSAFFSKLGIRNGDTLHAINGQVVETQEDLYTALANLKTTASLDLELTRKALPMRLHIDLI